MATERVGAKRNERNELNQRTMTQERLKERPLLFQTEMVQAILDGRKTQTRRIVKPQPIHKGDDRWDFIPNKQSAWFNFCEQTFNLPLVGILDKCPYGKPGDILWVREAWAPLGYYPICNYTFMYKADVNQRYSKWKPSIYMPKAASRIWLRITDVRVERLQQISGEDALKEGVRVEPSLSKLPKEVMALAQFKKLWVSINGEGSWTANPFVWVVSFEVLSTTGRPEFLQRSETNEPT